MKNISRVLSLLLFVTFWLFAEDDAVTKAAILPGTNLVGGSQFLRPEAKAFNDVLTGKLHFGSFSLSEELFSYVGCTASDYDRMEFALVLKEHKKKEDLTKGMRGMLVVRFKKALEAAAVKAALNAKEPTAELNLASYDEFPVVESKRQDGTKLACAFVDDGKALYISTEAEVRAALQRLKSGTFAALPEVLEARKPAGPVYLWCQYRLNDKQKASFRKKAEAEAQVNPLMGRLYTQLTRIETCGIEAKISKELMTFTVCIGMPDAESALAFRASGLEATVMPMAKYMISAALPQSTKILPSLKASASGKDAKVSMSLSSTELDVLINVMGAMLPQQQEVPQE